MRSRRLLTVGEQLFGDVVDAKNPEVKPFTGYVEKSSDGSITVTALYPESEFLSEQSGLSSVFDNDLARDLQPRFFIFNGEGATLALYGCYERGRSVSMFRKTVVVTYRSRLVVHGLSVIPLEGGAGTIRAEISGLFDWLQTGAIEESVEFNNGGLSGIQINTRNNHPVEVDRTDYIRRLLRADWKMDESGWPSHRGRFVALHSLGTIERVSTRPQKWGESIGDALILRDLLSISTWSPQEVVEIVVHFELSDSLDSEGPHSWHLLDGIEDIRGTSSEEAPSHHLYPFDAIGSEGVSTWFRLCADRRSSRAVQTLDLLLRLNFPLPRRIQLLGGAIDGMFHYFYPDEETSENQIGFRNECDRLRARLNPVLGKKEFPGWAERMSKAYNASKHAGLLSVDNDLDELRTYSEGLFVVRVLLAMEIGVPEKTLKELIKMDPGNPRRYVYTTINDPLQDWSQS
ncbi:hypothetical protein M5J20_08980 [Corynebacterium sp. TA-R-1]|uniref:ApeA N-terminal domain-containing protein n=1 Tax=Corynebacterium stercoris TaxID=2943490 RepID=A0ABT1G2S2_9CORY|nr:hypothetical protein [Corynebacterium stercoris]MCP1388317.1 hypothetical protein [Corynebacterium stercoris]